MFKTTEGIVKSLQDIKVLRIRLANQTDYRAYRETSYFLGELEDGYKQEIRNRLRANKEYTNGQVMNEYTKILKPVNDLDAIAEYEKQESRRAGRIAQIQEFTC